MARISDLKAKVMALDPHERGPAALAILTSLMALAYLAAKAFFDTADTIDFKFIWLAGDLWNQGIDAYTDAFANTGQQMFVGTNRPEGLLYPPSWYPIASLTAHMPYDLAHKVWRVASAGFLICGSVICLRTVQHSLGRIGWLRGAGFLLFISASSATAVALSLGQTSPLIFLGVSLFLHAVLTRSTPWMTLALYLVMLKPNFGIVFAAFLVAQPFWWRAILAAIALSLIASLPALLPYGPLNVLGHYAGQLSHYDTLPSNLPPGATGVRNLMFQVFGITLSSALLALLGAAFAFAIGLRSTLSRHAKETPLALASVYSVVLATALFAVSLHTYDLFILGPLLISSLRMTRVSQTVVVAAMMLAIFRGTNVVAATGLYFRASGYFPDSFLASIAILVVFVTVLLDWTGAARTEGPLTPNRGTGPAG